MTHNEIDDPGGWRSSRPVPTSLNALCDDGSLFPPDALPLSTAVERHLAWARSPHRAALGPLVVAPRHVDDLVALAEDLPPKALWVAVATTDPADLTDAMSRVVRLPAVRFAGGETLLPDSYAPDEVVPRLQAAVDPVEAEEMELYVEIPRDDRATAILDALTESDFDAKIRFGGHRMPVPLTAQEAADTILAAVVRHLPFKAAGGLRRTVTTLDADGRLVHGVGNVLLATDAARQCVDIDDTRITRDHLADLLGRTDVDVVVARLRALDPARATAARSSLTSCGVESPGDTITDLAAVGLVAPVST